MFVVIDLTLLLQLDYCRQEICLFAFIIITLSMTSLI